MNKEESNFSSESNENEEVFVYNDTDTFSNEISEFYSYFESPYQLINARIYENQRKKYKIEGKWKDLSENTRKSFIMNLLNELEVANESIRALAIKSIHYIALGCWYESETLVEQQQMLKDNVLLLYDLGAWDLFMGLFNCENERLSHSKTYKDTQILRNILAVLYLIVETLRVEKTNEKFRAAYELLREENNEEILMKLLIIIREIKEKPAYPVDKIALLLWKLILVILGDSQDLKDMKNEKRRQNNLRLYEDTVEMSKLKDRNPLKWIPKIKRRHINNCLNYARARFIGYTLENDTEALEGLPETIKKKARTLRDYIYIPLAEIQIKNEEMFNRQRLTGKFVNRDENQDPIVENLYKKMVPIMEINIGCLLNQLIPFMVETQHRKIINENFKIKNGQDKKNFENGINERVIDMKRRDEILFKAISAIILLLLKHFKLNHIYQFEHVTSILYDSGYIEKFIKLLQNKAINRIYKRLTVTSLEFKTLILNKTFKPGLSGQIDSNMLKILSWRNMFSFTNILRIIIKTTKWKDGRMLCTFPAQTIQDLQPLIQIENPTFQLYLLKFFKQFMKFFAGSYAKSNTKIIHDIFQYVRHRMIKRWQPHVFKLEKLKTIYKIKEAKLQKTIQQFHKSRYNIHYNFYCYSDKIKFANPIYNKTYYESLSEYEMSKDTFDWDSLLSRLI